MQRYVHVKDGTVVGVCEQTDQGTFIYNGKTFTSLTGAAGQNAVDIGRSASVNGKLWWKIENVDGTLTPANGVKAPVLTGAAKTIADLQATKERLVVQQKAAYEHAMALKGEIQTIDRMLKAASEK